MYRFNEELWYKKQKSRIPRWSTTLSGDMGQYLPPHVRSRIGFVKPEEEIDEEEDRWRTTTSMDYESPKKYDKTYLYYTTKPSYPLREKLPSLTCSPTLTTRPIESRASMKSQNTVAASTKTRYTVAPPPKTSSSRKNAHRAALHRLRFMPKALMKKDTPGGVHDVSGGDEELVEAYLSDDNSTHRSKSKLTSKFSTLSLMSSSRMTNSSKFTKSSKYTFKHWHNNKVPSGTHKIR